VDECKPLLPGPGGVRSTGGTPSPVGGGVGGGCEVATTQRFVLANGIAVTSDRQMFFVADTVDSRVHVLRRGRGLHSSTFQLNLSRF
jgi:sugar lactone lactonase YvrE